MDTLFLLPFDVRPRPDSELDIASAPAQDNKNGKKMETVVDPKYWDETW